MTLLPQQYPGLARRYPKRPLHRIDIRHAAFKDRHHRSLVGSPSPVARPIQQQVLRRQYAAHLLRQAAVDTDSYRISELIGHHVGMLRRDGTVVEVVR